MDQPHIIRFAERGSLMEFSPRFSLTHQVKRTWRRGEISAFSVRSRSRLNRKISMITHNSLPLFVTLTYHLEIPQNFEGYKYHLHHFFIRLLQKFPKAGIIWKLEYQWRGYAHFHLFVWNVSEDDLKAFVPRVWNEIAGYGSEDHLKWHQGLLGNGNEHCVQSIRSWNGVKSYASKYFAKIENDKVGGRVWGIRGSHREIVGQKENGKPIYKHVSNVPFSKLLEFRCSLAVALQFRQAVMRQLNFDFQRLGFWCANYEVDWLLFLDEIWNAEYVSYHPPDDPPDWEMGIDIPEIEDCFELCN
ncbi:MAG: hypothetical protein HY864_13415 [Chloroflexi bacterium]|nr:hypothetical protein [Chloroflexota bacterium]